MTKQIFNPLLESNFQKISESPYSIIIYQKGSRTIAEDKNGRIISSDTDATTVFNAAVAFLTLGGKILIRSGTYVLSGEITLNVNNVLLCGEFRHAAILQTSSATQNAVNVSADYTGIRDITIQTALGVTKSAGAGVYMNGAYECTVDDVYISDQFRGMEMIDTILCRITNATIADSIATTGIGVFISGGNDIYMKGILMNKAFGSAPYSGLWIASHGGGVFENIGIINHGYSIVIGGSTVGYTTGTVEWLFFTDVACDTSTVVGLSIIPQDQVVKGVFFENCWFASSTYYGIHHEVMGTGSINGVNYANCRVYNNGWHGVLLYDSSNVIIDDCMISGNSQAAAATYHGIAVDVSSQYVKIQGCKIGQSSGFGATHAYGVLFNGIPHQYVTVMNNDLTGNATGAFIGISFAATCLIMNNSGYNPQALAAIVVGASPFTYTNNSGYIEQIRYFSYSTTALQFIRAGVTTAIPSQANTVSNISLYPGDALRWTYSSTAPVIFRIPM